MEVPEAGAWGRKAPPVCAADPWQMRRALDQQLAMQRGYTQRNAEPCQPPLPGAPLRNAERPGLVEQLSAEVAALREQVAGLSRMVRGGAMQTNPFAPLLAMPLRSNTPTPSPLLWTESLSRLRSADAAGLEMKARLDYLSRTASLRRNLSQARQQPSQLAYSL